MTEPAVPRLARKGPYKVEVEAAKRYLWCACGRAQTQPFCDMTHRGSGLAPVHYTPEESGTVYLYGCKQTRNPPFCDGSHKAL